MMLSINRPDCACIERPSALITPAVTLAWNPSVAGGGKAEDTYVLEPDGLRRLTDTGAWPLEDGRPAALDVESGAAA